MLFPNAALNRFINREGIDLYNISKGFFLSDFGDLCIYDIVDLNSNRFDWEVVINIVCVWRLAFDNPNNRSMNVLILLLETIA